MFLGVVVFSLISALCGIPGVQEAFQHVRGTRSGSLHEALEEHVPRKMSKHYSYVFRSAENTGSLFFSFGELSD